MKEIYEKLKEELNPSDDYEEYIAEYIAWQLGTMRDQALAETTAKELRDGVFKLSEIVADLRKECRSRVCPDKIIYKHTRHYLKIDGAVSDAEAALYFLRDIPRETLPELLGLIKSDAPFVSQALDLGLDDLFGEG